MWITRFLVAAGGLLGPMAAAFSLRTQRKDMFISPSEVRPLTDLPIRVATSGPDGFRHVQFPIACKRCFPADASRPRRNLLDGLLEIDFRITREHGLDGDEGAQVNGYTVADALFPLRSDGSSNFASALRLFVDGPEPDVAPAVPVEGSLSFETIFRNATHDLKAVAYNLTKVGDIVPASPVGFRLSYMRAPRSGVLRIEQDAANIAGEDYPFHRPHLWLAVGRRDGATEHFAWRRPLDWLNRRHAAVYPGWDQDFVRCKTTACRVNKLHTAFTRAYDECVALFEQPDPSDSSAVPPGCYILLAGDYASQNPMWLGCALIFAVSQLMRWNLKRQRDKIQRAKNQRALDQQILDKAEEDTAFYLMQTEGQIMDQPDKEGVKARKGHRASDE